MIKKSIWVVLFCFALQIKNTSIYAQEYKGAVGARFGYGLGITGKYFFDKDAGHALRVFITLWFSRISY
jgi:hypothetical protein